MRARTALLTLALAGLVTPVAASATTPATTPATTLSGLGLARQTAARLGTTLSTAEDQPLASSNVSLVTTIPGTYIGGRVVGKRFIATGTDGISSFDISDPADPKLTGFLPLPHFENEDMETDGKIALISNDRESKSRGAFLHIIDVSNPSQLKPLAVLDLNDLSTDERGPGHIANCVKDGCKWVWLTGGARVWVADLRDPAKPKLVGAFDSPTANGSSGFGTPGKARTGATHDVERDAQGRLWVTGSGGMAAYDATNVVHPRMLAYTGKQGIDPSVNDFILHNSRHPAGNTVLVTEEDYIDTSETPPGGCRGQGKFQTWDVSGYQGGRTPRLTDQWKTEVSSTPFLTGNKAPVTANCSSHWFTVRGGVVADGWYEQGTRFLDVRNPKDIKQVGYWIPPNAVTWGAYWITDDVVYTADVGRGLDVLRVKTPAAGAKAVTAPIRASWLGAAPQIQLTQQSQTWKWMCAKLTDALMH